MSAPSVTNDQITSLLDASEVSVQTIFDKVTLVVVKLPNGFVLTASSGAVSKENYSEEMGAEVCLEKIRNELWNLEGYALQKGLALAALDDVLVARIKKWDAQKQSPSEHLNGCDPTWFDGLCEGEIRELRNVREMLVDLSKGGDLSWANPDRAKPN